jgi:serine protease
MRLALRAVTGWLAALLCLGASASAFASATNQTAELLWRKDSGISASVDKWPLKKLLARISSATGWKIYIDPDLDEPITVRFSNLSQSEALKLLLGSANYALVPDTRRGSKLYVYKNSMTDATAFVLPDAAGKPKNWIANEIILTLAPGSKQDVEKLAAELGGKIVAKSDGLNAYRLQFADAQSAQEAREKLAARQGFDTQDNFSFDRPTSPATSSNSSLAAMFPIDPKPVTRGDQVTVALVDTPVQPLDGKMKDFVLPSIHVTETPESLPSDPTHATSMAETVLNSLVFTKGASKDSSTLGKVRVLPIDIYGNSTSTTTFEVAQGLYQAIQQNAQVVNLSLGGTGESPMVDYLLEMAKQKQMLVFASAGNTPTTDATWPAANPNAIAVTAADPNGEISSYANRGSFVDVKAPGTSRIYYNGQTYISTGTSTATAFVSGQAAGLSAQGFTPAQTTDLILQKFNVNAAPVVRGTR